MFFSSFFPIVASFFSEKTPVLSYRISWAIYRMGTPRSLIHQGPCNWLDPFVTRCCSDFQDATAPACSRNLPSPGLAFNLCIGLVVLAQRVNISDVDQRICFFHRVSLSFTHR